jgi:hypothetical protein
LAQEYGDAVVLYVRLHTQVLTAADHGAEEKRFGELPGDVGQQTIGLGLDHSVALAAPRLQAWAIEHGDPASLVMNQPSVLQLTRCIGALAYRRYTGRQLRYATLCPESAYNGDEGEPTKEQTMSIATILLVVLVLMLVGALPVWQHASGWGYGPSGILGAVLLVIVVLFLMGRLQV